MPEPATDIFGTFNPDAVVSGALPPINAPKIAEGLQRVARNEAREKAPIYDKTIKSIGDDTAEVHRKYDKLEPPKIEKWDADAESRKHSTSPFEAFGSIGYIAAMIGSAFTKTPMVNAMSAGAAALTAIKEKDDKGYERAYEAFKTNTDHAIKQWNVQQQAYDAATKLLATDRDSGLAQLNMLTIKYQDQQKKALLDGGHLKEFTEAINADNEMRLKSEQAKHQIEAMHDTRRLRQLEAEEYKGALTPEKRTEAINLRERLGMQPKTAMQAEVEEIYRRAASENRRPTPQELHDAERRASMRSSPDAARRNERYEAYKREWQQQNPGKEMTADVMSELERKSKVAGAERMTDEAVSMIAERVLVGDRTGMINLGKGVQNAEDISRINNKVAEIAATRGIDPTTISKRVAQFGGLQAAARTLATRGELLRLAENEANTLIPRVEAASDKIDRTQFPSLNSLILSAQKGTGGTDVINLGIAVHALIPVYARVLKPTGQITEGDTQRAKDILDTAWSKGQIKAALEQMKIELESAKTGLQKTMKEFGDGTALDPNAHATGPVQVKTPDDAKKLSPGTRYLTPDGQEFIR